MRIRKAVIPAAGWGTRFLPATKSQPKEMLPLVDKPIIQYVVEEAIASGIEDILIITGRNKRAIEDHFDRSMELESVLADKAPRLLETVRSLGQMADIHFVRQKEQLGLGHAIYQARRHVGNEPFAVLLGDEVFVGTPPCLAQMAQLQQVTGGNAIAVREVPREHVNRYGIVNATPLGLGQHCVNSLVEKPDPSTTSSNLAIVGRYILQPTIFDVLAELPPGKNGEIQLTDGLSILLQSEPIYGLETTARRYDVGDKLGYLQATVEFALAREADLAEPFRDYLQQLQPALKGPKD